MGTKYDDPATEKKFNKINAIYSPTATVDKPRLFLIHQVLGSLNLTALTHPKKNQGITEKTSGLNKPGSPFRSDITFRLGKHRLTKALEFVNHFEAFYYRS